jgi:hypothetical protein
LGAESGVGAGSGAGAEAEAEAEVRIRDLQVAYRSSLLVVPYRSHHIIDHPDKWRHFTTTVRRRFGILLWY